MEIYLYNWFKRNQELLELFRNYEKDYKLIKAQTNRNSFE